MYGALSVWDAGFSPAYHKAGEAHALPGLIGNFFVEMDNFRTYR